MIPDETLMRMLTRLQLTAIRDQLANLLDEAARRELTLLDTIHFLCEAEIARKDDRRIQMGLSIAKFPCVRTIDTFDFDARPSIDPRQIRELASGRWVANGDALLLLGPPGVGKTHLAIALGREFIHRGYTVLFTTASTLLAQLAKAQHANRLEEAPTFFRMVPGAMRCSTLETPNPVLGPAVIDVGEPDLPDVRYDGHEDRLGAARHRLGGQTNTNGGFDRMDWSPSFLRNLKWMQASKKRFYPWPVGQAGSGLCAEIEVVFATRTRPNEPDRAGSSPGRNGTVTRNQPRISGCLRVGNGG